MTAVDGQRPTEMQERTLRFSHPSRELEQETPARALKLTSTRGADTEPADSEADFDSGRTIAERVPHFSRPLREVGSTTPQAEAFEN
jgi:hypothetical protein